MKQQLRLIGLSVAMCVVLVGCGRQPQSGHVLDEALTANRTPASMPQADEDYYREMDSGLKLTPEGVKGRNTWLIWTAGNDRFWDMITESAYGSFDLLKIISSNQTPQSGLKFSRDTRWAYFGLVNEPCFKKPAKPDAFGLWLDVRDPKCGPEPFENERKYPGIKIGARGTVVPYGPNGTFLPIGSLYGYATGVVGLRLFPNPAFDATAAKNWDPVRYYNDPSYYLKKDLVRPYRVGMSCAFCHVGPNPLHPPQNPEAPEWKDLSSLVGAQYFWLERVFTFSPNPHNFMTQLVHTSRPGTLDTSLISSDNINNPRTMNAFYDLADRLENGRIRGREKLAGGGLDNKQLNDYVSSGPLANYFRAPNTVWTPHVLKDGADSVGALGALNRVFVNIGLFSEEWVLHFNPLVGGKPVTPIQISVGRRNSSYWRATEDRTLNLALFMLQVSQPQHLADAPNGSAFLSHDEAVLTRGKIVFAETCARCHSSKAPTPPPQSDPTACAPHDYLKCFNAYWAWTNTADFKNKMRQFVLADDFRDHNYLSNDLRIPVTLLHTNACSPLATNGLGNNIWDNFTSRTYKDLPSVGEITYYDPYTGQAKPYKMPAGGRGYTRVPSLISVWSTAPLLLNNSVGVFSPYPWTSPNPSVAWRVHAFDDAIHQLLWPERRQKDAVLGDKIPGTIDRTTATSYLSIPIGYLPDNLRPLLGALGSFVSVVSDEGIKIGPIPKGTPVDLLANLQLLPETADFKDRLAHDAKVLHALTTLKLDLEALPRDATDDQARAVFLNLREQLMSLSKCPDFIVNRGHYFGTGFGGVGPKLSDADKEALIAFIKTF